MSARRLLAPSAPTLPGAFEEAPMLFSISWKGSPAVRNATAERFLKSGGMPPAGVRLIGRWHEVGSISGIAIAETEDPLLMSKWALDWNDMFELEVRAVVTDEQVGPLLAETVGKQ
jgi:hypothetical protein